MYAVRPALPLALLASLAAGPLEAQQAAPDRDAILARTLVAGRRVLVHTPASGRVQGTVLRAADGVLQLRADSAEIAVPIAEVDSVWQRGNALGTGALVGAAAGFAAGLTLGLIGAAGCDDCDTALPVIVSAGTVGGGLVGAGVGAAVGRWVRAWPAR